MVDINGYSFSGFFISTESLKSNQGVYVVVRIKDNKYKILDVGEAGNIKERIENHDRKECWEKAADGHPIKYGIHYTPEKDDNYRREIEKKIRNGWSVPCGVQ